MPTVMNKESKIVKGGHFSSLHFSMHFDDQSAGQIFKDKMTPPYGIVYFCRFI